MIVQVQALLYASLTASLFSAFLAMLGKQWLNRYMSTDMRGTVIERSRNRQQKLNGIVTWYFDYVMESLPMMLQVALLLLGCALSRYLWEMDTTVASVILGVTSLGLFFYLFIVIAGSASASCPYQTPGSRILRSAVASAFRTLGHAFTNSRTIQMFQLNVMYYHPWWSRHKIEDFLRDVLNDLPRVLASDGAHLWRALFQPLIAFVHKVHTLLPGVPSTLTHDSDNQTTLLDLQCISWILQTSLDKDHHLLAIEHLVTTMSLHDFNPFLIAECFGALISCIKVADGNMVIQELEKLATLSAMCLHKFSYLSVIAPSSYVLVDICKRYARIFPRNINLYMLSSPHTFGAIHFTLHQGWRHQDKYDRRIQHFQVQWKDYKPSSEEHIVFSHALANLAQSEYQRREKVPCWILRFVLHTLPLHPPPSTSIIADCLSIIAISLGCDIKDMILDERYAHV